MTALVGSGLIYTQGTAAVALETTALSSNAMANAFATFFIIVRLMIHKRRTIERFGHQSPALRHLHFVNILLQSAAINVPITIVAAAGLGSKQIYAIIVAPIAVTCQVRWSLHAKGRSFLRILFFQSFSSVLIIYQVALRRAIDDQKEGTERNPEGGEFTSGVIYTVNDSTVIASNV